MFSAIYIIILLGAVVSAAPNLQQISPLDGRIVDGQSTDISKHPWQASIQYNNEHICGGIILTKQWILTAAFCVHHAVKLEHITVRVGSTNTNTGGQVLKTAEIIIHPDWEFDLSYLSANIALIKLESLISTPEAHVASLPTANTDIPDGASVAISGWGLTKQNSSDFPTSLLEVTLTKVSNKECSEIYSKTEYEISEYMLCAGINGTVGKGPCDGDVGGPATYNNTLVGIVSWGMGCADVTYPSVYVRVSKFLDWISSNID